MPLKVTDGGIGSPCFPLTVPKRSPSRSAPNSKEFEVEAPTNLSQKETLSFLKPSLTTETVSPELSNGRVAVPPSDRVQRRQNEGEGGKTVQLRIDKNWAARGSMEKVTEVAKVRRRLSEGDGDGGGEGMTAANQR
ncbi:hypothetical protein PIB30_009555 [Stylosanthes scabra]|uniref:Uncharacterized protein n=1 Tax=Stylosanthes scabra TaxID=79078 RepID=A0ABU6Q628_9FABA|nr:hypothetical protein [Stylosanthes scabra]